MIEKTPKRIELKCLYKNYDLPFLERNLLRSSLSFYEPYQPRFINSIYFDSPLLSAVDESLNGSSLRTKNRCRWYGDLIQKKDAIFEFKKKHGHLSWKFLVKNIFLINSTTDRWENFITPEVPPVLAKDGLSFENQFPVSIVRYRRKYFVDSSGQIRVTIDDQLQFYDQRYSSAPNTKICEYSNAGIVIEIKLPEKYEHLIPLICNKINFTPSRFSKYCESVMHRI